MDAFVTGTLPQKRQTQVDVNKEKSERKKLDNPTVVISILVLQSQKGKALSIRNVLFVAEF